MTMYECRADDEDYENADYEIDANDIQISDLMRKAQKQFFDLIELQHKAVYEARETYVPNNPQNEVVLLMEDALEAYKKLSQP